MRASATSRIASHASVTSAQASNNAKADDAGTFALMLAAAAPAAASKAKGSADQQADSQSDQDNASPQDNAAPQTVVAQTLAQAAGQMPATPGTQPTAKPGKDTKTDGGADPSAQAVPAAPTDPSAVMTVAIQPPPQQQTAPSASDNDGDDTVDAVATAAAPTGSTAPTAAAAQGQASATDAAPPADAAQQAQQAAAQLQAPQPVAARPAAKAAKPIDATTDKAAPRKTADAGDGVKSAQTDANKADINKADSSNDAPQPASDAKPAAQVPQQAPNLTLTGITAPQPQSGVPQQATAAQATTTAQHVEVTAQPNVPALAVEIAAKSQSGAKQFDIRLDPPELGRVEVRLSIDTTGKASAHLSADQPQTLDLLQKDAPALTRALRDAGLDVSQNGLNFSLRQQAHDNGQGNGLMGSARNGRISLNAVATTDTTTNATSAYRAPLDGRLDIRV